MPQVQYIVQKHWVCLVGMCLLFNSLTANKCFFNSCYSTVFQVLIATEVNKLNLLYRIKHSMENTWHGLHLIQFEHDLCINHNYSHKNYKIHIIRFVHSNNVTIFCNSSDCRFQEKWCYEIFFRILKIYYLSGIEDWISIFLNHTDWCGCLHHIAAKTFLDQNLQFTVVSKSSQTSHFEIYDLAHRTCLCIYNDALWSTW